MSGARRTELERKLDERLERRGNAYRARIKLGNDKHSLTEHTTDRRDALANMVKRVEKLQRAAKRKLAGDDVAMTVSELLSIFSDEIGAPNAVAEGTRGAYADSLKPITAYFVGELGDPFITAIRAREVNAFVNWRRKHRITNGKPAPGEPSPRTVQKDWSVLRNIRISGSPRVSGRQPRKADAGTQSQGAPGRHPQARPA